MRINLKDRVLCALLYTAPFLGIMTWAPILTLIFINLKKIKVKDFVQYHCYQTLLLNMLMFFIPRLAELLIRFLETMLDLFMAHNHFFRFFGALIHKAGQAYSIAIMLLAAYGIIWTLRGRFTHIPSISQAVNLLLR